MKNGLHMLRLAAIVTFIGSSSAIAQTGTGSTGAAGGGAAGATGSPAAPGGPAAGATKGSSLSRDDSGFLSQAAQNGHAEVEASKLAMEKATDAKVKAFAKQMIDDHTKANKELETLASSKGVELPSGPSLVQQGKSKLMLSTADGADFDRRYAESMGVDAHKDTIELFQKAAQSAKDAEVKAFAQKTLPKLQEHLKMAEEMVKGLPKK
jgi:putative membrane protein